MQYIFNFILVFHPSELNASRYEARYVLQHRNGDRFSARLGTNLVIVSRKRHNLRVKTFFLRGCGSGPDSSENTS